VFLNGCVLASVEVVGVWSFVAQKGCIGIIYLNIGDKEEVSRDATHDRTCGLPFLLQAIFAIERQLLWINPERYLKLLAASQKPILLWS
jgi:hypothetical protein